VQQIAELLGKLGMSEYAERFAENDIDIEVLGALTDTDFDRLGVSIGHRRKILKAIAADLPSAAGPLPSNSAVETVYRAQVEVNSTSWSTRTDAEVRGEAPSVPRLLRPAEMIGRRPPTSPQVMGFLPTGPEEASDADIQVPESGEGYVPENDFEDAHSPRWRDRLVMMLAVVALAGLGSAGAFAYRAAFLGDSVPTSASIKTENETTPREDGPSNPSQASTAGDRLSDKFTGRWPASGHEAQQAPQSADQRGPTSAVGSGAVGQTSLLAAPPTAVASPAIPGTSAAWPAPAPVPAPLSATGTKKIHTAINPSQGSRHAAASKPSRVKPSSAPESSVGNQPLSLVPQAESHASAAKPRGARALPDGNQPLSLGPNGHARTSESPLTECARGDCRTGTDGQ
jgi:hypothetical protein